MTGLEALKEIKRLNTYCRDTGRYGILTDIKYHELYDIIEKELKALELLKELVLFNEDTILCQRLNKSYILYIGGISFYLSKEQYDLLNEVIKWN